MSYLWNLNVSSVLIFKLCNKTRLLARLHCHTLLSTDGQPCKARGPQLTIGITWRAIDSLPPPSPHTLMQYVYTPEILQKQTSKQHNQWEKQIRLILVWFLGLALFYYVVNLHYILWWKMRQSGSPFSPTKKYFRDQSDLKFLPSSETLLFFAGLEVAAMLVVISIKIMDTAERIWS